MPRIIFMGTPEFAVPVLDTLTHSMHTIVGVYTRPDQPAGRGKAVRASPVKRLAESRGLPVFQPLSLRQPEFIAPLRDLAPDVIIVAAYGLILPRAVLSIPPRGCVNTHASLLPRHRGAAPIPAAILAGDSETGVTLMQMDAGLDTGPILAQRAIPIAGDDTTATLTPKLAALAATLLIETLPRILAGEVAPQPQDDARATLCKTIRKEEGLIDWKLPAVEIARRVRAFNPWPSAYTFWNGVPLKILLATAAETTADANPGRVTQSAEKIAVACGDGALILREVQLASKRAMKVEEFVRGQRGFVDAVLRGA
ncbi:MAG: methionyl-tRNA formyltransferase [Chloroflexota bacterium]|nr:methionyl-tRNA formyltransferase [Chloroflexota bacterium]